MTIIPLNLNNLRVNMSLKMKTKLMKALSELPEKGKADLTNPEKCVKLFNALGCQTWFLLEHDTPLENESKDRYYIGYADLGFGPENNEFGTIDLFEMFVSVPMLEMDLYFSVEEFKNKLKADRKI